MSAKSTAVETLLADGRSTLEAARAAGVSIRYAQKIAARRGPAVPAEGSPVKEMSCRIKTVPVAELIDTERLDHKKVLRDGLQGIPEGAVARDETLRKDLGISADRWRELARDEEFSAFRAILPNRRVVWGRAKTISELKRLDGVS